MQQFANAKQQLDTLKKLSEEQQHDIAKQQLDTLKKLTGKHQPGTTEQQLDTLKKLTGKHQPGTTEQQLDSLKLTGKHQPGTTEQQLDSLKLTGKHQPGTTKQQLDSLKLTGKHQPGTTKQQLSGMHQLATLNKFSVKHQLTTIKKELNAVNVKQFKGTDSRQAHAMLKKLFDIKKFLLQFTHEEKTTLLEVDNKIQYIVKKLEETAQNTENYITKNDNYRKWINQELTTIEKSNSLKNVNIPLIDEVCGELGIYFEMKNEYLDPEEIKTVLIQMDNELNSRTKYAKKMLDEIHTLSNYIAKNKPKKIEHDTRDTQSMRNVIGISIAVCAIVTLCIVLLIAVHNKHRANAEVRLLKWV